MTQRGWLGVEVVFAVLFAVLFYHLRQLEK
jgi:hypothetical protein